LPVNGTASAPRDRRKRRITGHIQRVWTIAADPGAEANLAWAVAEAVKPRLSIVERDHVYVAIGVGEMFTAIHWLIRSAARDRIVLSGELVQRCGRLDAYVGHAEQRHLHGLLKDVLAPRSVRDSVTSWGDRAAK